MSGSRAYLRKHISAVKSNQRKHNRNNCRPYDSLKNSKSQSTPSKFPELRSTDTINKSHGKNPNPCFSEKSCWFCLFPGKALRFSRSGMRFLLVLFGKLILYLLQKFAQPFLFERMNFATSLIISPLGFYEFGSG